MVAADTADQRRRLKQLLSAATTVVLESRSRRDLWSRLTHLDVDIVVCGRSLLPDPPDPFVSSIRELPEHPEVVVLSDREDASERAGLLAAGCLGVLYTGLPNDKLSEALGAFVTRRRETERSTQQADAFGLQRSRLADFVSDSSSMTEFMTVVRRVVDSHSPLLILGETGVGKERLARAVHTEGPRSAGPFVPVNCGALPEGLLETELFGHELGAFTGATRSRRGFFELAHGGTLFLDEIGDLALHLQVKLLRVLEERSVRRVGSEQALPIDVRVIAATNRQLEAEVEAKQFRADLYYRLAVVSLVVPPLRDRREDIPALVWNYVEHFRKQVGRSVTGVSDEAMERLLAYSWPGNVRELINVIERAVLLARTDTISLADLPTAITRSSGHVTQPFIDQTPVLTREMSNMQLKPARRMAVDAFERAYLSEILRRSKGSINQTAALSGVDVRTIHTLMKRHRLAKESFK